jgi:hypothetical protein
MNAMQLVEFFSYDYKLVALALLSVEQREGREVIDKLLQDIQAPTVRKNLTHFVARLREILEMTQEVSKRSSAPAKPVAKEKSTVPV